MLDTNKFRNYLERHCKASSCKNCPLNNTGMCGCWNVCDPDYKEMLDASRLFAKDDLSTLLDTTQLDMLDEIFDDVEEDLK